MGDQGFFISGPAVGVGDGTLLVDWPCRLVADGPMAPFNLCPIVVWTKDDPATVCVLVMDPTGCTQLRSATSLQFDPGWKRK